MKRMFPNAYKKPADLAWSKYDNQDTVVIHRMNAGQMTRLVDHIKQWTDDPPSYQSRGATKVGHPKQLVLLSEQSLEDACRDLDSKDHYETLCKRFTQVYFGADSSESSAQS